MSKKKIFIFDDVEETRKQWCEKLKKLKSVNVNFDVETADYKEFKKSLEQLKVRQKIARKGEKWRKKENDNIFDNSSILMLDYDLFEVQELIHLTGEIVAYLARCYSTCGLIIGINQYGKNTFDLTLKGHLDSFCDLNIGSDQLDNRGLWEETWDGFRPWYWHLLPDYLESFERCVREVKRNLDEPILEFLEFPGKIMNIMPRTILDFWGTNKEPEKLTFRQFVEESNEGLRRKDKPLNDDSISHIAVARIRKWLERLVLPGQNILIDAPHLVTRFPSLLKGNKKALSTWNNTTLLGSKVSELGIEWRKINKSSFKKKDWLARPAWYWNLLAKQETITEVEDPFKKEDIDYVFCEDLSRFLKKDKTRTFVAELPTPYVKRYVANPDSLSQKLKNEMKEIDYRPAVRLTL